MSDPSRPHTLELLSQMSAPQWYAPEVFPGLDQMALAEPWSIPSHDVGVVTDRVHTLTALPHHYPPLKRPETLAEFKPELGAIVVHFYGGLGDVACRLPWGRGSRQQTPNGEHRWVLAGLTNRMGMMAVIATTATGEATVTILPMPQETYRAVVHRAEQ